MYPISLFPKAFVDDTELPLLLDKAPLTGPPLLAIGERGGGGYIVVVEMGERDKLSW